MRVTFKQGNRPAVACSLPYEGCRYVVPSAPVTCTSCDHVFEKLQGGRVEHDHDTYRAPVRCPEGHLAGELRVRVDTIFGIDEDRRVLSGRARVY
jgi:hypothetical protein